MYSLKKKKINNENGMFFLWEDYKCKGNKVELYDTNNNKKEAIKQLLSFYQHQIKNIRIQNYIS